MNDVKGLAVVGLEILPTYLSERAENQEILLWL
jgi:hypothetical protein